MAIPIQQILRIYDKRISGLSANNIADYASAQRYALRHPLEFFEPDLNKFRCLALAFEAIERGGNMPCIINAANEIVNRGFLEDRCGFLQMAEIIEETMGRTTFINTPSYDDLISTDKEARRIATELMTK